MFRTGQRSGHGDGASSARLRRNLDRLKPPADADRDTVDEFDRVRVPPDQPQYSLRRVWLTPEEEQGFYLGFANEGLWPLCHIAHTRPVFRVEDWEHYQTVNRKFAEALLEENAARRKIPWCWCRIITLLFCRAS